MYDPAWQHRLPPLAPPKPVILSRDRDHPLPGGHAGVAVGAAAVTTATGMGVPGGGPAGGRISRRCLVVLQRKEGAAETARKIAASNGTAGREDAPCLVPFSARDHQRRCGHVAKTFLGGMSPWAFVRSDEP